jgi:uncharacterized membrane protein
VPFDGGHSSRARKPAFNDLFTVADCRDLMAACDAYLATRPRPKPANLTWKQKALASKNRKVWARDYTLRLGAAERLLMTDM